MDSSATQKQDWTLTTGFLYIGLLLGLNVALYYADAMKKTEVPLVKVKYVKVKEKVEVPVPTPAPACEEVKEVAKEHKPVKRETASIAAYHPRPGMKKPKLAIDVPPPTPVAVPTPLPPP